MVCNSCKRIHCGYFFASAQSERKIMQPGSGEGGLGYGNSFKTDNVVVDFIVWERIFCI